MTLTRFDCVVIVDGVTTEQQASLDELINIINHGIVNGESGEWEIKAAQPGFGSEQIGIVLTRR